MTIQIAGVSATRAQLTDLRMQIGGNVAAESFGMGRAIARFAPPSTATMFEFSQTDAVGGAHSFALPAPPAEATFIEVWNSLSMGSDMLAYSSIDPASIATGASLTGTVTVPGALFGDAAEITFGVSLAGLAASAYVSAADTVTWVLTNITGAAVDLAASLCQVRVRPAVAQRALFVRTLGGQLAAVGTLAGSVQSNLVDGKARWAGPGESLIVPLLAKGTLTGLNMRFAFGTAAGAKLVGSYGVSTSDFPWLASTATEFVLTGDGATTGTRQFPYSNGTSFPEAAATAAVSFQVCGLPARMTLDGTTPGATLGRVLQPGNYVFDCSRMGAAVTVPKFYMPPGCNIIGTALKAA